ncbi:MAG: MerR family transcriptional regulator [Acidobacteriaceae bacterium]
MAIVRDQMCQASDSETVVTCDGRELSAIAGIDENALRRYGRLGLLQRHHSRYCHEDLVRIERIVMMKLLGFAPSEIKGGLNVIRRLTDELEIQKRIWFEKKRRLSHLLYFLEQAEQVNIANDTHDWHFLGRVVAAMRSFDDPEFFRLSYLGESGGAPCSAGEENNGGVDGTSRVRHGPDAVS